MKNHEFEFSYDSDRLAEIYNSESCIVAHVLVGYNTYYDVDQNLCTGLNHVDLVHADGYGEVTYLKESDHQFLEELVREVEKRDAQMIEKAKRDEGL